MPNNLKIDMNGNGLKIAIVSARFNEIVTRTAESTYNA